MVPENIPIVIMTSPKSHWTLDGMFWTMRRYWASAGYRVYLCGYDGDEEKIPRDSALFSDSVFVRIGDFAQYPHSRWSDSFIKVCQYLTENDLNYFIFMMDDFWLVRHVDANGVRALWDGMCRSNRVLKIDLASDRLYAAGGTKYLYGANTIGYEKHIDLIQSDPGTMYHMSLWGGLFNARLLLEHVLVPGESAQDIEIAGTRRLKEKPEILVYGTRQCPMRHTNILRSGHQGAEYRGYDLNGDWVNGILEDDLEAMKKAGVELR